LFGGKYKMPAMPEGFQDNITQAIAGNSGGIPRISIRGGAFRQIVGGKEVNVSDERSMNIVLINAAPIARTYYGSTYDESAVTPPKCWSADGVTPASDVPATGRQHDKCATCPMNIKGSGQGDTRACRFSQRLAVLLDGEIEDQKVYQLSVPATSIFGDADGDKMPLQAYGKFLSGHGIPITGVVTEARFDTAEAVPVLKFRAVRPLEREEWEAAKAQSLTEDAAQAVEFKMVPSKADNKPAALPAAFKDAAIPAKEEAAPKVAAEEVAEPVKRETKAKATVSPAASKSVSDVLEAWATDDE